MLLFENYKGVTLSLCNLLICMMMIEDGVRVPMTCLHVRAHHIF